MTRAALVPTAAALVLLAASAAGHGTARVASFAGGVQPDPGSRIAASRNGKAVAFEASFREAGTRFDPAADPTVFVWERTTGSLVQVSATGPCDQASVENGTVSLRVGNAADRERRSRTLVAFRSTADPVGRNGDGSSEIFLWDSSTGGITQVTDALSGDSSMPAIGARFRAERDAKGLFTGRLLARYRIAFLSTADLTGDNPAGLPQVFLHDSGAPEVGRLVQVSHSTTGAAGRPAVDGSGRRVAFVHDGDVIPGDAPPPGPSVYLHDVLRGTLRLPLEGDGADEDPVLDASGRTVAWASTRAGSPGAVPVGRTVWIADGRRGRMRTMAPPGPGDNRSPTLGRGRRRAAFVGTAAASSPPVPAASERPLVWRFRGWASPGRLHEAGPSGPGGFGAPVLAAGGRLLFLTSTADLDGTNASGRNTLFAVEPPR